MGPELVEIHPRELTFVFELKKQSSDSIQLFNSSDQYIAFKVKTTSPKKYCVRPNVGIIKPKSTCDFTVTMQAQREAPPYMQCKDKFLIQSTIVPYGTKEENISSAWFSKSSGKYIEEKKLRVVLISPVETPLQTSVDGDLKQDARDMNFIQNNLVSGGLDTMHLSDADEGAKIPTVVEVSVHKNEEITKEFGGTKNVELTGGITNGEPLNEFIETENRETPPGAMNGEKPAGTPNLERILETDYVQDTMHTGDIQAAVNNTKGLWTTPYQDVESEVSKDFKKKQYISVDSRPSVYIDATLNQNLKLELNVKDGEEMSEVKETDLNSTQDVDELNSKLDALKLHLNEAERTISKLVEERRKVTEVQEMLEHELALVRQKTNVQQVYDGFPLLFVVMVALVSLACGYFLRP